MPENLPPVQPTPAPAGDWGASDWGSSDWGSSELAQTGPVLDTAELLLAAVLLIAIGLALLLIRRARSRPSPMV